MQHIFNIYINTVQSLNNIDIILSEKVATPKGDGHMNEVEWLLHLLSLLGMQEKNSQLKSYFNVNETMAIKSYTHGNEYSYT